MDGIVKSWEIKTRRLVRDRKHKSKHSREQKLVCYQLQEMKPKTGRVGLGFRV
jgi:hypothetical protein